MHPGDMAQTDIVVSGSLLVALMVALSALYVARAKVGHPLVSIASATTVALVVGCFFWRVQGQGGNSSPRGLPGYQWFTVFTTVLLSQGILSAQLLYLWATTQRPAGPKAVTRCLGMLCSVWNIVHISVTAVAMFGAFPEAAIDSVVLFLLVGSAVEELLIGASCLLFTWSMRGALFRGRHAILLFNWFISVGCCIGMLLSSVLVICRERSYDVAWDIISMVSPLYRVTFLITHLCYQRWVLVDMFKGSDPGTRVYPSLTVTTFTTGMDVSPSSSEGATISPIRTTDMTDSLSSTGGSLVLPAVPAHLTPNWHHLPDSHVDKSSESYPLLDMAILTTGTGGKGATMSPNAAGSSSPGGRASMLRAPPTHLDLDHHRLPDKHV